MEAKVRLDQQLLAVQGEHQVHAMLELNAPPAAGSESRQPLNIALVIDRSGSMHGPKLHYAKEAARFLVQRMSPRDKLALVVYDNQVEMLSALQPVDRDHVSSMLSQVFPRGSTNLSGGWLKGVEELQRPEAGSPRKVLLFTDGVANQGITDNETLVAMAQRAAGSGVGTTTIGFGERFNEDLLTQMAEVAGGKSYYAASPEDAPKIFTEEFEDLASIVAQNVSVEIRPTDDVKVLGILNEYPSIGVPGGIQVNLGDAYGEEQRRVVFELHIPELVSLGVVKVADVVVRYVSVGPEVAAHEITLPLTINLVSADEAADGQPDRDVVEEVLILKAAEEQRRAREEADRGDFSSSQARLLAMSQEIAAAAPGSAREEELRNEATILRNQAQFATEGRWGAASSKAVHYDRFRKRQSRRRPPRPTGEQK